MGEGGQGYSEGQQSFQNEVPQGQAPTGGMNPAWNDVLGAVPSEYHSKLIPHFQGWDQNFQKVQSSIAPYKEFVDAGVDPEHIRIALGFARALDENPQAVYEALAQEYGQQQPDPQYQQFQNQNGNANGQQFDGQGLPGADENPYGNLPPEFMQQYQAMQQDVSAMRDILLHQHNQTEEQQQDAELDNMYQQMMQSDQVFASLNQKGEAEPYINSLIMAGYNEKQALDAFHTFVDSVRQFSNRPQPPVIMGAGGFMPERVVKPREMTDRQANDVATSMLLAHRQQQQ